MRKYRTDVTNKPCTLGGTNVLWTVVASVKERVPASLWVKNMYKTSDTQLTNKKPTRCHLLILFYFLETQHVSGINMPIFRSLQLCCWTTTLAVSFCKNEGVTVSVNVWFLVVCDWCDVFCLFVVASKVFLLTLTVLTFYVCCSYCFLDCIVLSYWICNLTSCWFSLVLCIWDCIYLDLMCVGVRVRFG